MKQIQPQWYDTWFDTPYYHILYKNRDDSEAEAFMSRLVKALGIKKKAAILDVACGKGRHAIYLNKIGYDVMGIDLSQNSINHAKQFENETLHFLRHDMCIPLDTTYDAVLNLFTSFGYFEKDESNVKAIQAMKANMKPDAYGVIDFLNIHYTLKHLKPFEIKAIDGIDFKIEKWVENNYLFKQISFNAEGQDFEYTERLKCIDLALFQSYFDEAGLVPERIYGNYNLDAFDKEKSERLVIIFKRK